MRIHGFKPILPPSPRLLILGSMPGQASLAAGEYYAHPRNAFWPIMLALLNKPASPLPPYTRRRQWLLQAGIAVWDVYAACERRGSLDTNIARDSGELNDIGALVKAYPSIALIATNGQHAAELFRRHWPHLPQTHLRLPSTSPANARLTAAQKHSAWQALMPFIASR